MSDVSITLYALIRWYEIDVNAVDYGKQS